MYAYGLEAEPLIGWLNTCTQMMQRSDFTKGKT